MSSETSPKTALTVTGESFERVVASVREPLVAVAFWTAIALPFLHLPLLFVTGLTTTAETASFVTLLGLNVVSLVVGYPHGQ